MAVGEWRPQAVFRVDIGALRSHIFADFDTDLRAIFAQRFRVIRDESVKDQLVKRLWFRWHGMCLTVKTLTASQAAKSRIVGPLLLLAAPQTGHDLIQSNRVERPHLPPRCRRCNLISSRFIITRRKTIGTQVIYRLCSAVRQIVMLGFRKLRHFLYRHINPPAIGSLYHALRAPRLPPESPPKFTT